jgi:hypothetical protein
MAIAGTDVAIFSPKVRWAPLGTEMPERSLAFKAAWPTGWNAVENFEDNIGIDTEAQTVEVDTKDKGPIAILPDGPGEINISAISQSVGSDLWARINRFTQVVKAAITSAGSEAPALVGMKFDPSQIKGMMLGFEGFAKAGSFFEQDHFVRCILFNAQTSSEGGGGGRRGGGGGGGRRGGGGGEGRTLSMGWGGENSWNKVSLNLKAVPYSGAEALLTPSGYDTDLVDDEGRMLLVFHRMGA